MLDLAVEPVPDAGDLQRSVRSTTSTTVIWFMVSVPVLSELMADVDPSVSTEVRFLTMALRLARSMAPMERMTCETVGSASGMAAMARATAVMKSASHSCRGRARGRT